MLGMVITQSLSGKKLGTSLHSSCLGATTDIRSCHRVFLQAGIAITRDLTRSFRSEVKCVNDACMWADSIENAFFQACEWFDLCAKNGITLNPNKFQFAQYTVDFALTVTPTNVKPYHQLLESINKFPEPKDITGACACFGQVNQGAYALSMAQRLQPFRQMDQRT